MKEKCLIESKNHVLVRSLERQEKLGEVFTPTNLVLEMLDKLSDAVWQEEKIFIDPTCGNGQLLVAVAIIKLELGHKNYLETIYGVDIMQDNIDECRQRLDSDNQYPEIMEKNIICADALTYHYRFDGTDHGVTDQDLHNESVGLIMPEKIA